MNLAQAAARVGVTRRTLYYWMRDGMSFVQHGTGRYRGDRRVAMADLLEWQAIENRGGSGKRRGPRREKLGRKS